MDKEVIIIWTFYGLVYGAILVYLLYKKKL